MTSPSVAFSIAWLIERQGALAAPHVAESAPSLVTRSAVALACAMKIVELMARSVCRHVDARVVIIPPSFPCCLSAAARLYVTYAVFGSQTDHASRMSYPCCS